MSPEWTKPPSGGLNHKFITMARNRIVRTTFTKCERGEKVRNPKFELAKLVSQERGVSIKRAFAIIDFQNSLLKIQ